MKLRSIPDTSTSRENLLSFLTELGAARRPGFHKAWSYLRDRISSGEFAPGNQLPTAAILATRIGVSRPVVLEALSLLEAQGQVRISRGRGGIHVLAEDEARTAREAWLVDNLDYIR